MTDPRRFATLKRARRVWAVASIHGEARRLERLHAALAKQLLPGDRIVYLGNMIGRGPAVAETIDQLLRFRAAVLAGQHSFACDIAYLRGSQEEMWQKLLQIQFATDSRATLNWMLDQGIAATLEAYGSSAEDAQAHASGGAVGLTRWTGGLRQAVQERAGHTPFYAGLRRAALTEGGELLFVNSGLDPARPLDAQRDSFWWSSSAFGKMSEAYGGYRKVVRGFAPERPGIEERAHSLTLDGGCGFGGPLLAACLDLEGRVAEILEG